jgi:hypothetical protein
MGAGNVEVCENQFYFLVKVMLYNVCQKAMQTTQYHMESLACNYENCVGNVREIEPGDI